MGSADGAVNTVMHFPTILYGKEHTILRHFRIQTLIEVLIYLL